MSNVPSRTVRFALATSPAPSTNNVVIAEDIHYYEDPASPRSLPATPFLPPGGLVLEEDDAAVDYMTQEESLRVHDGYVYPGVSHDGAWEARGMLAQSPTAPYSSQHSATEHASQRHHAPNRIVDNEVFTSTAYSSESFSPATSTGTSTLAPSSDADADGGLQMSNEMRNALRTAAWDVRFAAEPTDFDDFPALLDPSVLRLDLYIRDLHQTIRVEGGETEPISVADIFAAITDCVRQEVTSANEIYSQKRDEEKANIQEATATRLNDPSIKWRSWRGQVRDLLGKTCLLSDIEVDHKDRRWVLIFGAEEF